MCVALLCATVPAAASDGHKRVCHYQTLPDVVKFWQGQDTVQGDLGAGYINVTLGASRLLAEWG